ncbi:MAG: hypothetical protein Q8Q60_01055 [Candidatus Chromulinivorax sp.]|nr:hypothetical protein [Candidatus Chromulinivorax sp.]
MQKIGLKILLMLVVTFHPQQWLHAGPSCSKVARNKIVIEQLNGDNQNNIEECKEQNKIKNYKDIAIQTMFEEIDNNCNGMANILLDENEIVSTAVLATNIDTIPQNISSLISRIDNACKQYDALKVKQEKEADTILQILLRNKKIMQDSYNLLSNDHVKNIKANINGLEIMLEQKNTKTSIATVYIIKNIDGKPHVFLYKKTYRPTWEAPYMIIQQGQIGSQAIKDHLYERFNVSVDDLIQLPCTIDSYEQDGTLKDARADLFIAEVASHTIIKKSDGNDVEESQWFNHNFPSTNIVTTSDSETLSYVLSYYTGYIGLEKKECFSLIKNRKTEEQGHARKKECDVSRFHTLKNQDENQAQILTVDEMRAQRLAKFNTTNDKNYASGFDV